ncbi:MAG: hypothetical protein QM765_22470 [Myxococcales bacterium]
MPLEPTCLGISSDGLYAVVGHDAKVSYVDLKAAQVIRTWPISAHAGSIVLGDPMTLSGRATRFAYVFPVVDGPIGIHNLDLGTGAESTSGDLLYEMDGHLAVDGANLFAVPSHVLPARLHRFAIDSSTGIAGSQSAESPYWGDPPIRSPIWLSLDGATVLTSAGTVFRTSDLTYAGEVSTDVGWADWSQSAGRWLVQPGVLDDSFWIVDSKTLADLGHVKYPRYKVGLWTAELHGRFLFHDSSGAHPIAVVELDPVGTKPAESHVLVY